jgi:undecaprenyl-diphosphatase
MSLISWMIEIDKSMFVSLNNCHAPFFDNFFWIVTGMITWIPFYAMIMYMIVKSQPKGWWITVIALAVLIVLCDQISNSVIKHGIERLRPSHEPTLAGMVHIIAGYTGGKFGFVSSHAANSFGLAMFIVLLFRNKWLSISILSWAVINSYSRIYVGVHYPGDILGGALVGVIIAFIVYRAYQLLMKGLMKSQIGIKVDQSAMSLTIFTLILSFVMLLISAKFIIKLVAPVIAQ